MSLKPAGSARRPGASRQTSRFAEVAGGTAAGCAAICCCCPCGLVNLLVLTIVRLPAGLCRKAIRKQRLKRRVTAGSSKKTGLLVQVQHGKEDDRMITMMAVEGWPARSSAAESEEMDRKMWAEFYGAGFWRSPSQREEQG